MCREFLQLGEENTQEEIVIVMIIEDHLKIEDPLTEGGIQMEVRDSLTKEDTLVEDPLMVEDPLEEDIPMEMGDPLEEEDTLVEDPLMEEDPLDPLEDKDYQALKDPLDQ